jgi:D-amino-acid dehydrogenase
LKVAVVGGGVIGLACAWYLRRRGAEVTVLERDEFGMAASRGNAGWISPGLSNPLPAPGVTAQALRWMLRSDSPFLLRPRLDPDLAAWLWRFWRSSGRTQYLAGMQAMLALNERTLELYDQLVSDGVEFEMHKDGLLFLFLDERAAEEEAAVLEDLQRHGYPGDVRRLTVTEAQELDPAVGEQVKGVFLASAERHVRPESLTSGLASALRDDGVELRAGVEVTAIAAESGGWRLRAADEQIAADRVVLAAGAWTGRVLAPLGVKIRQEAAKGYSLTTRGEGTRPRHALYLGEAKVGCSPFEDGVRLAGTLELAGIDLSPNRARLEAVARSATRYLHDWRPVTSELDWAGLRPLPPDGLPLIGPVPGRHGLFVATGHGMMGVTLAPSTGAALAPLILEDRLVPELRPFRIDR